VAGSHVSFSLVNPVTDGNDPIALPIKVLPGDCATQIFPLPTYDVPDCVFAGDDADGSWGGITHLTFCQTVCGYVASKHPAAGVGVLAIYACHAGQLVKTGGGPGCDCAGATAVACNDGGSINITLARITNTSNLRRRVARDKTKPQPEAVYSVRFV
jgi:hypothetical protein